MSIKKYFEVTQNIKSLSNKSADDIASKIESVGYHEQDIIAEERFIPRVNYSDPASFARYGYAADYYAQSIKRIYSTYPYDGSLKERLEWENDSTYLDLHIFNDEYPRTNGYVILSADGWGGVSSTSDGYGLPAVPEYIYVKGGPNTNPNGMSPYSLQFTGSNYYEPSKNRASNLQLDVATKGASVEFWLNKTDFITGSTEKEVIFDLWNGETSGSTDYGRLRVELSGTTDGLNPFLVTLYSGSTGFFQQSVGSSTVTTSSIADGLWHHYAVTVLSASNGVLTRFYVDGQLDNEQTVGSVGLNNVNSVNMRANVGALIAAPSGTTAAANAGKLSGSLDEFRYWKAQRSSEQVGLYWFTQVGGGVNSDPTPFIETSETANINLGVYFKFNEGITGIAATDSVVLDYSGRVSNGSWEGYTNNSRNTGSAIVISNAAIKEFKDPIIYSFSPLVESLSARLQASGSAHDGSNNASIYKSIPSWITEEDDEGTGELKKLTQIISSYFDTLHLQVESLTDLKNIEYTSGSNKPLPFAEKLLTSNGLVSPELFIDADILEKLNDRSEDLVYEKSLQDIKNTIYQNIYNNLSYVYKSKGTLKAFRNLIRCFGIDEELVRVNMYADNVEYQMRNNRTEVVRADRFVNFNTTTNQNAVVYSYPVSTNSSSVGFITASSPLANGYAYTMETEVILPLKPERSANFYFNTNAISSSVFGIHGAANNGTDITWPSNDEVNFQVFTVRDEVDSANARFVLTGTAGGVVPELSSDLYEDIYNDTRWNLAVRVKPENYPLSSFVDGGTTGNYIIELCGHRAEAGVILEEFVVSGTITAPPAGFITGSRRPFIGAHRTNFTGTLLQTSDVKTNACRYWLDYVEDHALKGHVLDTENYGSLQPHLYAYPFNTSASFGDITKFDTLVFNWEFLTNTGSNASGEFTVEDLSSGSADFVRFGELGNILNKQYTAQGALFGASSTTAIDKDFVVSSKLNLPEQIYSEDMVKVLDTADQDVFMPDTRPIHYYFAFEKSMYQTISVEIINYFANLKDFNNLIGDAINQWRPEYKSLKFMRQKFFEKVGNEQLDFEKFYEFYKWFDTSLSVMLAQLVPASADFSDNILTVIEDHILERSKYQRKFPFIEKVGGLNIGPGGSGPAAENDETNSIVIGIGAPASPPVKSSPTLPSSFQPSNAATQRQLGRGTPIAQRSWKQVHAPVDDSDKKNVYWHRYLKKTDDARHGIQEAIKQTYNRRIGSPVNLSADGAVVMGGVAKHQNARPNYTFAATAPWGPTVPSTNIPINIMVSFDSDVEELVDTTDVFNPSAKQRLGFGMDPSINTDQNRKGDGNIFAPLSLYSSSVNTGYNQRVQELYKSGTMVTDLHHDFVGGTGIPMQGPFTEKYVGGRQYRHIALNDGTDTRETRPEGFRVELGLLTSGSTKSGSLGIVPPNYPFGNSPSGSAPQGFLPDIPIAPRLREEAAKRPVNIRNIQLRSGSTIIGNYEKNYQVVSTAARTQNDLFFRKQTFDFSLYPETTATRGRFPLTASTSNVGGNRNYELPERTGSNSNQTVIVNRFSAPGSYEVMSRGYMDPAHEELSVYNAAPYRNQGVINYGLSGSASVDPVAAKTITVVDQIGKNRGLQQRATLHCGPFGSDAAYGSVPELTYVTVPSWHKTNRNPRKRIEGDPEASYAGPGKGFVGEYETVTVYDNLFVQHAIPRSTQQYSWVTASLATGESIFGLQPPSCYSASTLTQLITSSTAFASDFSTLSTPLNFVGLTDLIHEPLTASSHILGYPLGTSINAYVNSDLAASGLSNVQNAHQLHRNGPYGYPTWKQIRTGDHPIARKLRASNMIGQVVAPSAIPNIVRNRKIGYISPEHPNTFVDYFEPPIMSRYSPVKFFMQDDTVNSNKMNDMIVSVPFGNDLDWFNHEGLNNRLGLTIDVDTQGAYNEVVRYITTGEGQGLRTVVNHSQRVYPAAVNVYSDIVRSRTEFSIAGIWNNSRSVRSELSSETNSQGITGVTSASVWPLDGHLNFTTTSSVSPLDGSGELMNAYSRYYTSPGGLSSTKPAATYASRLMITCSSPPDVVRAGDTEWLAPSQAGKDPYVEYVDYAHRMRLVGKDMSIVPEFRISSHIATYESQKEGDFLANIDGILELTGAAIQDSSEPGFFQTYTNADFMKYFKAIDEDLYNKRSTGSQLQRDKISLKCDALVKFLPYKGFYPAERTLELATLFSQSYGPTMNAKLPTGVTKQQAWRAALEPMFAPGIIHNTIKSGLAVSNFIVVNTASMPTTLPIATQNNPNITAFPEGNVEQKKQIKFVSAPAGGNGYGFKRLPFETLYEPMKYLGSGSVTGSGFFYDTGVDGNYDYLDGGGGQVTAVQVQEAGSTLYERAADNFLCEVINFFDEGLASFVSKREDEFQPVVSGTTYTMRLKLHRTLSPSGTADYDAFEMYSRATAFGTPFFPGAGANLSLVHVTPPYFSGSAMATFTFAAAASEVPTLDTILSNTTISFERRHQPFGGTYSSTVFGQDPIMQIDSCFNLTDYINSVPPGTVESKKNWLIQSKFETPVMNFADVTTTHPPSCSVNAGVTNPSDLVIKGMWHQYGLLPSGSSEGIFATIENANTTADNPSLASIVGFPAGRAMRIGNVKKENLLEEAVVAVPFKTVKNRRMFFTNVPAAREEQLAAQLNKYVFPPRFDFTRHDTIDPILMYTFEFSAKLSQQDIADMWQNLPPSIADSFEQKEVIIEEKEVLNLIAENSEDIQWMVFKVKKRAKKSFEKYRRSLVTEDTSAFPDTIGEYSYNWPYDYFSLVELIKIDEGVQYKSGDATQSENFRRGEPVTQEPTTTRQARASTAIPASISRAASAQPNKKRSK